jgi:hypothetical protein
MATEAAAQRITVRFDGGYVVGPRATLQALFGNLQAQWVPSGGLLSSGRKRKYGSRQASNNGTGEPIRTKLTNGEEWTVRLVGNHVDFIDKVLANVGENNVDEIVSQRGTLYSKVFVAD